MSCATATRYPFPVPEWCRRQWASEKARDLWLDRLQGIQAAWQATERMSVGTVRAAALQVVEPSILPTLNRMANEKGLSLTVLGQQGASDSYQAAAVPVEQADGWTYRVALTTRADAISFAEAWDGGDDETLGALLGFPECCRDFYRNRWVEGGWRDTTWPMVADGADGHTVAVEGPVECNILLRWLGVRWVPHLPCAFDCEATAELGGQMRDLMERGFGREAAWADELLESPVEWSAWHGIARIKTPVVEVSAKTDATAERLVVRRVGSTYPEAGAAGLRFPYHREPETLRSDRDDESDENGQDVHRDNGFASRAAMRRAHDVIASVAPAPPLDVLDLGCGNGVLARRLAGVDGRAGGVEVDPEIAERARERLDEVVECDVLDLAWSGLVGPEDIVVLMPGRLVESGAPEDAAAGLRRIVASRILVYAYGDWLDRYGSLAGVCEAAGMNGYLDGLREEDGVSAAMWRWA